MDNIEDKFAQIKEKIAQYELGDVYDMGETGLLYNVAPGKTIARRQIEGTIIEGLIACQARVAHIIDVNRSIL